MPTAAAAKPQSSLISPLSILSTYPMGTLNYYGALAGARDELVKVGAICALLELERVKRDQWAAILELSRYGAIRARAFNYFVKNFEYELAEQVAATQTESESKLLGQRMVATLHNDIAALRDVERGLFLATGRVAHLYEASNHAETIDGWRASTEWSIRGLLLRPMEDFGAGKLMQTLMNANQHDLLDEVIQQFERFNVFQMATRAYKASLTLERGDPKSALKILQSVPKVQNAPLTLKIEVFNARARAFEKLGEYREAYKWFLQMNKLLVNDDFDAKKYAADAGNRGNLPVPKLPHDEHENTFMMLGFPRSGTTLLENVLNAHPKVETFEEIPSLQSAFQYMGWRRLESGQAALASEETYIEARHRYYVEIDRRRKKPAAMCLIDKMPIRSSDAKFLVKLFPDKRYIFSIRHPFDVVLSCFKQAFEPNNAMQNFLNIPDAVALYDFVMTQWFDTFSMDDPRVHYLRYDDLVTDFENSVRGALDFLGVGWDDSVRDFAKTAETRKVKTPSYQKVRSGLSIGVQSSWRKYRFLFETPEAKPLRKWAEFFGYDTK